MDIASVIAGRPVSEVVRCDGTAKVRDAVAMLANKRIGALPIMDAERVIGIFSERDVIYRLAEEGSACLDLPVSEVMTMPAITVDPQTKVDDALGLMSRRRIRHLPVVERDAMRGFISIGDLVKSRIDEVEHEAAAMRNYIQTA